MERHNLKADLARPIISALFVALRKRVGWTPIRSALDAISDGTVYWNRYVRVTSSVGDALRMQKNHDEAKEPPFP